MAIYYVNNQAQSDSGDHEVHKSDCKLIPSDKTYLGDHRTCKTAVEQAKLIYPKSDGCAICSAECHKS